MGEKMKLFTHLYVFELDSGGYGFMGKVMHYGAWKRQKGKKIELSDAVCKVETNVYFNDFYTPEQFLSAYLERKHNGSISTYRLD